MNWIHRNFGLHWQRPAGWIIAEAAALIVAQLFAIGYTYSWIEWAIEVYEASKVSAQVIREERQKVAHYEGIVLACLRHDVVKVNGVIRVCEL